MGWSVYGEVLSPSDIDGTTLRVAQKVTFNANVVVKACRAWFIVYNNPTFSTLGFDVYADDNDSPGAFMFSTTTRSKAELITLNNGIKEAYFELNDEAFTGTDSYWFAPKVTGAYVGNETSHLAWKKAWPDPVYRTSVDSGATMIAVAPYDIYFIGSEL